MSESTRQTADHAVAEWDAGSTTTGAWPLLPAFLRLAGRRVVVVGGGAVAAAKFADLRLLGARLVVVAPHIGSKLRALGTDGVELHERAFVPSDLDGAWYVVAAATREVNRAVMQAAESRRIFVNAVDDLAASTAFSAAVLRRGELSIAVSTAGRAPALAGLLREALEELVPPEAEDWACEAARLRRAWKAEQVALPERRELLLDALIRRRQSQKRREGQLG